MKVKVEPAPIYTFIFDEVSNAWVDAFESNRFFLLHQQEYMNQKLKANGHVFLNEVLDALGLPRTQNGQVVGWVSDGNGDNYIDFGLNSDHKGVNGAIVLNFNVDGYILDKI